MKRTKKTPIEHEIAEDVPFIETTEKGDTGHIREHNQDKDYADLLEMLEQDAENTGSSFQYDTLQGDDFVDEFEMGNIEEDEENEIDFTQAAKLNTELLDAVSSTAWGYFSGEDPESFLMSNKSKRNIANAMVPLLEKYMIGGANPEIVFIMVFVSAQATNYMHYRTVVNKKKSALARQGQQETLDNIYGAGANGQGAKQKEKKEGVTKTEKTVTRRKQERRTQTCTYCGQLSHNKRSCKYRQEDKANGINRPEMPEDERIARGVYFQES